MILVSVFQQSWAFKTMAHTVNSYLEAEVMTREPYQFTRQIPPVQASWNIGFLSDKDSLCGLLFFFLELEI